MSTSPIVALLAQRPTGELESLRAKMRGELEKLADARGRIEMELQQVDDAIARQGRRKGTKAPKRRSAARSASSGPASNGPTARERVAAFVKESGMTVTPTDVYEALSERGFEGSQSAVYNALGKLLKEGTVEKVGDGLYKFASPNGAAPGTSSGTSENGHHEPLSLAASAQDGD